MKEEEFARAISLALFDYMRKSRSRGFVVSISGGADSAAVSCLVAMMVGFGVAELGRERFLAKLKYFGEIQAARRKSRNGAAAAGVRLSIHQPQRRRHAQCRPRRGRSHRRRVFGIRRRSDRAGLHQHGLGRHRPEIIVGHRRPGAAEHSGACAFARRVDAGELRGALLASTSNRSEAAVGYATMDGDTSGGISPIAGIDKAFLRRWLRWLETEGPDGLGPIPALHAVNVQDPTAELRPPGDKQTDEADLMPYDLLDAIERAAIRDKRSPMEVFQLMQAEFRQYTAEQLLGWVERFFQLWCRNQWKRERYAPSFHVDDENLDPKTWCRFPILSGGYERELAELREYVLGKRSR